MAAVELTFSSNPEAAYKAHCVFIEQSPPIKRFRRICRLLLIGALLLFLGYLNDWGMNGHSTLNGKSYDLLNQIVNLIILLGVALGIGLALSKYWEKQIIKSMREDFEKLPLERYDGIKIRATEGFFEYMNPIETHRYQWRLLGEFRMTDEYLFLTTSQGSRIVSVPRTVISNEQIEIMRSFKNHAPDLPPISKN